MKGINCLLTLFLAIIFITACDKNNEPSYDAEWKKQNEDFFFNIPKDSIPIPPDTARYHKLTDLSTLDDIYYKILVPGKGEIPYFTDSVKVIYTGWLINDSIFDTTEGSKYEFTGRPFKVSGTIAGWRTALQNMPVGSKWRIIVPWALGYGANGSGDIPGYSTLIFDMELKSIINR
ncbi:MAG: FKBP-type peptidyl-prolyl cis-trans isomerase [Bacteroidales bacterium]|nr:FKBP-type peptidyl-prolyl cis-trans isomerase [Bacteroidales bacterium]